MNLKIIGIFKSPPGGSPFGAVTMSTPTFDQYYSQPLNIYTFAKMNGGVTSENTQALENTLQDFPNAKASTRSQFKNDQVSGLKNILNILYVLLALSVVVSLFGIVNTLVLTVFERTREVGMLRAIGLTRRQTRQMIRQESVITALIGAVIGIVLGLVLAGLLTSRLDFTSFVVPVPQLDHLPGDRDHCGPFRRDLPGSAGGSTQSARRVGLRVAAKGGPLRLARHGYSNSPCRMASATAAARSDTPSFS